MRRRRYALVVDPVACDGSGLCAALVPECIRLDPWGFPLIESGELPGHLLEHARRAVASCPRLALTLVETHASAARR
jgi:ferredoxin